MLQSKKVRIIEVKIMYRSVSLNGKAIIQAIIFSTLRRKNEVVYIHVSETFWHTFA
jgi:hypothetical protein